MIWKKSSGLPGKKQQQKTINIFGVGGSSGARLDNNTSQHNNKAALQKAQGKKKTQGKCELRILYLFKYKGGSKRNFKHARIGGILYLQSLLEYFTRRASSSRVD